MTERDTANLIPELDRAGLRSFGLTTGAIFAALFGLILPFVFGFAFPVWPWVLALVLAAWALAAPASLRPVYRAWMHLGLLLHRIVSPLVLGVVFFLVVTPFGIVMRLFGGDPMARKAESKGTCRKDSVARDPKHMERPY